MKTNFKRFIIKVIVLVSAIFLTRVIFQFPVEYFNLALFKQTFATRAFSKIDALKILAAVGLFFAFYYRKRIARIKHPKISIAKTIIFSASAIALVAAYYAFRYIVNLYTLEIPTILSFSIVTIILASSFLFFILAVF
jgi:hypothetical protein